MKIIGMVKNFIKKERITPLYVKQEFKDSYMGYSVCGGKLKGKHIVVTGANSGIGFSIAERLVKEECNVILIGRNKTKIENAINKINSTLAKGVYWNCVEVEKIEIIYQEILEKWGVDEIDGWINCHGMFSKWDAKRAFRKVPLDDFKNEMNVNLNSIYQISVYVADKMQNQKEKGTIISISSICGIMRSVAYTPYGLSKAGIMALTNYLAKKYVEKNVTFIAIAPGAVATNFCYKDGETRNIAVDYNILRRMALPEEISALAVRLVSSFGKCLNGQTIIPSAGEKY